MSTLPRQISEGLADIFIRACQKSPSYRETFLGATQSLRAKPGEAQVAAAASCHVGCGSAAIPGSESAIPSGRVISQTPRRSKAPSARPGDGPAERGDEGGQ